MKRKKRILNYIFNRNNNQDFSRLFNRYSSISRLLNGKNPWTVSTQIENGKIIVTDEDNERISILHRQRIGFYKYGIRSRVISLLNDYFIDLNEVEDGDVFIDCGANIGEIGLGLKLAGKKVQYIAFEPGTGEIECCRENNPEGTCEALALWHEQTTLSFFEKSDSADSSLIEFGGFESVTKVEATTLDAFCAENNIQKIKFLKIEGEGAEPEILQGAEDTLRRVKYICVDCGPERGHAKEPTLPVVCRFLMSRGFTFDKVSAKRLVARFVAKS